MANYNVSAVYSGLGTFAVTSVPTADYYFIQGTLALPGISKGDAHNSQAVILVKKNGSTIYTSAAGDSAFRIGATCAAGDAISIVLSSSLAEDIATNSIKTNVYVTEGVV